jgi:hypothetical protein
MDLDELGLNGEKTWILWLIISVPIKW